MQKIIENLDALRARVAAAEQKYGRDPGSIKIVGVSKKQAIAKIKTAAENGLADFAENHLQEAFAKLSRLKAYTIHWHFIGNIQSNKAQPIAEKFTWVHSVDRAKIAVMLNEYRPEDLPPLNVLIQVNIDHDPNKGGVNIEELPILARYIAELPKLKLRGLMTVPYLREEFEEQREPFQKLKAAYDQLNNDGLGLDTLSMGMSNDFEAAIAEGSTLIRIGTAIFGPRGM